MIDYLWLPFLGLLLICAEMTIAQIASDLYLLYHRRKRTRSQCRSDAPKIPRAKTVQLVCPAHERENLTHRGAPLK